MYSVAVPYFIHFSLIFAPYIFVLTEPPNQYLKSFLLLVKVSLYPRDIERVSHSAWEIAPSLRANIIKSYIILFFSLAMLCIKNNTCLVTSLIRFLT